MLNLMTTPAANVTYQETFAETANRSTDSLTVGLLTTNGFAATAVVLFFIGFFGFFLNLIVILLMIKDKELRTPMNVILFNLVCSDFSVSVLGNPFTLTSALFHHWIFGSTMCIAYGFFMSLLGITSITTLTVLSFERYVMISRPFRRHQLSHTGARLAVVFIWLYSFALTGPPLVGWGQYVNEAAGISCSVNWEHSDHSTTTYIVFLFILGLVLPVAVITFSYVNIVVTIRQTTFSMSRVTRAEAKVAVMVGVMITAFLIAWTPYAVMALIIAFGDRELITPSIAVIPALVAKSSICYNPIIYAGLNSQASWRKNMSFGQPRSQEDVTAATPAIKFRQAQVSISCSKLGTKVSSDGKTTLLPETKKHLVPDRFIVSQDPVSEVLHVTYHLDGNPSVTFH